MRCNESLVDKDTDKMLFWYGMGAKCDVEVIWSRFGMDNFLCSGMRCEMMRMEG